jgi:hypothetical protein
MRFSPRYVYVLTLLGLALLLAACASQPAAITESSTNTPDPTIETSVSPTPTPLPTETARPTLVPSTPLTATVWEQDPFTVVLTYHQFAANHAERSTALKVRFEDFEAQLNQLYDAGFSLVTLEDWMAGQIVIPEGRRPLILSLDDLYFNNQIRLDESGEPIAESGLGILWRFYQEHPDFGYSAALFVNLGNKLYGNPDDPDWEMQLAEMIAWGIDHDLVPYNHFYTHPQLHISDAQAILWELEMNDNYLRELLTLAGREDLIPGLENMIALTYGVWPQPGDIDDMLAYTNPEGDPVRMVAEIDLVYQEKYLPAPYDPDYDPFRLPRHVASPLAIDFLVEQAEKFPVAQFCDLGDDPEGLSDFIASTAVDRGCPDGVYIAAGLLVRVSGGQGEVITLVP